MPVPQVASRCRITTARVISACLCALAGIWGGLDIAVASADQAPVAAYSFDAGEGSTLEDVTGNEHDGAIEGASWFGNGKYGSALSFDGVNDCVSVADAPDLQLTEELTLEAWVKPQGDLTNAPVIYKEDESFFSYAVLLGIGGKGFAEGYVAKEGENYDNTYSEPLEPNVWNHIAFTYDGAIIRLYVNGEFVADHAAPAAVLPSSGPLQIGCAPNEAGYNFEGLIDEIRIYNRALDGEELRRTMDAGFPKAITEAPTAVEANDAVLNGTADANGGDTAYFFEYGPTKSYGSVAMGEELGNKYEATEISEAVIDLVPETTYHYRLVAYNPAGTAHGKDQTLTTAKRAMTMGEEEELMDAESQMNLIASESKAGAGDFYGMMWTGDLKKMQKQNTWEAIERSGAKVVRFAIYPQSALQPEIKEAFEEADKRNLTALPYLGAGPFPKAGTQARENWITYAKEAIKSYGPDSPFGVRDWEIWNEPNMSHVSEVKNPDIEQGEVKPGEFAVFFKEMAEELRSATKKTIQILTPGLYGYRVGGEHPEFHLTPSAFLKGMDQKLAQLGYGNAYNAISLHPYVFKVGKPHHPLHAPKDEEDVTRVSRAIQSVITKTHDYASDKPIWITELGFPVASPNNTGAFPPVTKSMQKQLVRASFTMMQNRRQRLNIAHAFYYNIQDDSIPRWDYHAGLLNLSGNAKPAWTSFSNLAGGKGCPHAPC